MFKKVGIGVFSTAIVLSTSIGFSGIVSADSPSANEQVRNGGFEDGLNNWILSNPNSSTENIGTSETGNHYLKLIHADTAYQLVTVKPNTEYTLTFDVAGSIGSPTEVTVGNLNATQEIVPLTKKQYTGFKPEHHEMKFKTEEDVSNFAVKLASTANGRAKFDNVQLKEKEKSYIFNVDFDHNSSLEPLKPFGGLNYNIEEHAGVNNSKGIHINGTNTNSGFSGLVTLKPNTTYILSASGKLINPFVDISVLVKGYATLRFTSSQYEQKSVEFTTLNSSSPSEFKIFIPPSIPDFEANFYLDDIVLVEK
ncbi:choline-binding protein A [Bacillus mycoides]|uniref:carbohydrate binding domain-containing protein n=1 Tax=Bacillus cereus group TaxID=86661 RepID=UPI00103E5E59|nr:MULTISPECIES: carbohydrate binding domain-containing protein [Bacillus cereus group]QWG48335.1 choline-binding protein A [Bacillus mycoides]TBX70479.1 choline-binding protein A [Bacillus mycoides]WJE23191.1 carbohydrate binding domain-containing protein [Bacillus cereus]